MFKLQDPDEILPSLIKLFHLDLLIFSWKRYGYENTYISAFFWESGWLVTGEWSKGLHTSTDGSVTSLPDTPTWEDWRENFF